MNVILCIIRTFAGLQIVRVPSYLGKWRRALLKALEACGYDEQESRTWLRTLPRSMAQAQIEAALGGFSFSFCHCQVPPWPGLSSEIPTVQAQIDQISTQEENGCSYLCLGKALAREASEGHFQGSRVPLPLQEDRQ